MVRFRPELLFSIYKINVVFWRLRAELTLARSTVLWDRRWCHLACSMDIILSTFEARRQVGTRRLRCSNRGGFEREVERRERGGGWDRDKGREREKEKGGREEDREKMCRAKRSANKTSEKRGPHFIISVSHQ